ncbi:protein MAIN-LIKE 1-like [Vicia villosa]|uniref:protein MAIN-LIKE 1-like n=1 Tax=Vicia villosa TaxID=3911 RepID=UPI00273B99CF|nr:protein MAIN-LIKE 1-like [Vicia villosa]
MEFTERWHLETSSFHLPHGDITITLDDIACLLHIPIRGTLLSHGKLMKEEPREMLIMELGVNPEDALEEVEGTCEAHVRFHFLRRRYDAELLTAQAAAGDDDEVDIHRQQALRCYFLFMLDTQLFMNTSSTYTDVVYLRYLSDIARVREYNLGAATLVYSYHRLEEGYLWKASWILQHFPEITGWVEVSSYTETIPRAKAFAPSKGIRCWILTRTVLTAWSLRTSDIIVMMITVIRFREMTSPYILDERIMRQFGYQQTTPRHPSNSTPNAMICRQLDDVFAD